MKVLAVCHVHSDWSYDGSWSLSELAAKFSQRGCRVLMMTEHDRGFTNERFEEYRRACAQASSEGLLVIPGIEYSDALNRVHVLTWGTGPFLGESLSTDEMLKAVKAANGIAVLAHPSRKDAWQSFAPHWTDKLLGIEVWNRKYDGWAPSTTAPDLVSKTGAIPFVGLDFHTERQSFPLGMALDLQSAVTEAAVLDCLRARGCEAYAFGAPLGRDFLRRALPVMRVAEKSRRTAARIARRAGVL
jgi:predicted metal-dependent phosphoesterase TrpH